MVAQKMTKFPENLEDIKALHLSGTAIKEVPSSIQFLTRLCVLDMSVSGEETPHGTILMVLPGSEIPEWFGDKGIGSSLTIQLPSNCHQPKGIAFYLVFLLPLPPMTEHDGDDEGVFASRERRRPPSKLKTCDSDHMILHYEQELVNH
ncbi:hypothetical protein POTOM_013069 [Populus tomentosa]|uniref:C-JID domain-containing protein n=1 Tax=Populus tomentosa TaxID=118781 RepID=A0A8X8D724_POPTO|nr:hypothetical protein POTOM_013069 [Populus tomentosa]